MTTELAAAPLVAQREPSRAMRSLRRFFRDPKAVVGAALLVLFVVLAVGGRMLAPYGEREQNPRDRLQGPSLRHLMGTDRLGRDIFSRVIYGTRTSISVGLLAVGVASLIGVPLGLISGYLGGWADEGLMRFVDAW